MTHKPLVSIITPTYNGGRFLEECIRSVLEQDYPHVEHIIQDAGSTDETIKILKKYSGRKYYSKIKWVSIKDNGQSDGLNKAIKRSRGDILLVLNADDALMPYACSWAVTNLDKYPEVGAIYGDIYLMNEQSEIVNIAPSKKYSFEQLLSLELVPPAQATFIRRGSLKTVGLRADKNLDTCPDFEMFVRLCGKFSMKHVFGFVTKYRTFIQPQLDSGQARTAERFVKSKRIVLDRLFNSKGTPDKIKDLRLKSYAGLYYWGSVTASAFGQIKDCVRFKWLSLYYQPTMGKMLSILRSYKISSALLAMEFIIRHSIPKPIIRKFTLINNRLVSFESVDINRVKHYWDDHPCNIGHSSSPMYTKKYFDEVEKKKYFVEPHIPGFAEFKRWKGKHILEIGCGIGTDTINFARNGAEVTAVDISSESIKIAKLRAKIYGLGNRIKFYQSDAENLSKTIAIKPYDLVYSFGVIHHTPHPYKVIEEIKKYCNENTILKIMVYNRISWKVFWIMIKYGKGALWNLNKLVASNSEAMKDSPVTYTYTQNTIRRLLQGFTVTKINIDHIFPYEIPLYKQHEYKRVWYFNQVPLPLFRLLEQSFGWHLLVEAKLQN